MADETQTRPKRPRPELSRTGEWVMAGILVVVTLAVAAEVVWSSNAAYVPGQWRGEVGFSSIFTFLACLTVLGVTFVTVAVLATWRKRGASRIVGGAMILSALVVSSICVFPVRLDPANRYRAERAAYLRAVQTGVPFGDQYEEKVGARTLTFWRWAAWDIDNAVGVIYDPLDRFSLESENDLWAFRRPSHGNPFRIRRMERGWYLVEFS